MAISSRSIMYPMVTRVLTEGQARVLKEGTSLIISIAVKANLAAEAGFLTQDQTGSRLFG